MRIVVVGGGIMGLATAWHCAQQGHRVELVEQGPLPNPLASSWDRSRLIRYPYGVKDAYARMVRDAYRANDRVFAKLGLQAYVETGTLIVVRGSDPWAEATRASLDALSVAYELLDADALAERFPLLEPEGVAWALWTPTGGVLLADRILDALIADLRRHETAHVRARTAVKAVDLDRACALTTEGDEIAGDRLIVAAGPWTADLLPELAPRVRPSRQVSVDLEPPSHLLNAWRRMPMLLDGIAWQGSGFYAVPPVAALPIKVGDHSFSLTGHPDRDRDASAADRAQILALARAGLVDGEAYRAIDARTCFYTVAPDERFIAEAHGPSLVLAGFSGHGFKFGALVGAAVERWCADAIGGAALRDWLAGHADVPLGLESEEKMTGRVGLG